MAHYDSKTSLNFKIKKKGFKVKRFIVLRFDSLVQILMKRFDHKMDLNKCIQFVLHVEHYRMRRIKGDC